VRESIDPKGTTTGLIASLGRHVLVTSAALVDELEDYVSIEEARKALKIAQRHLARVQVASFDPADYVEAVTFAFYAYENAVVAVAEANNLPWSKNHYEKAKLAKDLFDRKILVTDVEDQLRNLNDLRKDVAYDEPGPELQQLDL